MIKKLKTNAIVVGAIRKTSKARATLIPGTGKVYINKKPIDTFPHFYKLSLLEPLLLSKEVIGDEIFKVDIYVNVRGGGVASQIDASRLAIARALISFHKSKELKEKFLRYDKHLLVADTRRKEQRKPNDSKARAARQKSYR